MAALALHALAGLLVPRHAGPTDDRQVVAEHITISRRPPPTPRPTPRPTPTPKPFPKTQRKVHKIAPRHRAAPHGRAAPRRKVVTRPRVRHTPPPRTIAKRAKHPIVPPALATTGPAGNPKSPASVTGVGAGATGFGAGAAGHGNGTGGGGTGDGSGGGGTPCGFVELTGLRAYGWSGGAHYRMIRITVHLSDGEAVAEELHWPFYYPNEAADPFSEIHRNDDFPALLQLPPKGFDLAGMQQSATVFAVEHTGPDGYTDLKPCPGQGSNSAAP